METLHSPLGWAGFHNGYVFEIKHEKMWVFDITVKSRVKG